MGPQPGGDSGRHQAQTREHQSQPRVVPCGEVSRCRGQGAVRAGLVAGTPPRGNQPSTVGGQIAWQAGGGLIYDVSNRMAVDLGYRFFTLGDNRVGTLSGLPPTVPGSYLTNYSANELLLTIRIYEPFRRWR